jgi:hypothetical protein
MDETLRLLHPSWDSRLCLMRVGRRGQQSVNYVWKPVVSSLWAIPGPPLPDSWHRAAPEVLHAPPPVSLRRLRVARVVQSRRVRAASVAAHAPASPLIIRAGPQPHGRVIGADVPDRPTRQPSSGGGLTPLAASAARRRRAEQPDQEHDKSEKEHRSTTMSWRGMATGEWTTGVWGAWAMPQTGGFRAREDGLRAARIAYVPAHGVRRRHGHRRGHG